MKKEELTDKYVAEQWGNKKVARAAFKAGWESCIGQLWKDAEGEELPEIDKEVIAIVGETHGDITLNKVVFAHRPKESWQGKNICNGEVETHYPKRYGKGGWNQEGVRYWLDAPIPMLDL